jgi:hypothetical protein
MQRTGAAQSVAVPSFCAERSQRVLMTKQRKPFRPPLTRPSSRQAAPAGSLLPSVAPALRPTQARLGAGDLQSLQQTIGNHTVQGLIQTNRRAPAAVQREESGIGQEKHINQFVKSSNAGFKTYQQGAQEPADDGAALTANQLIARYPRRDAYVRQVFAAANAALSTTHAPPTTLAYQQFPPGVVGRLEFSTWELQLSQDLLRQPFDQESARSLAATIYHETRHAEQFFRMARVLAGKGKTADMIMYLMVDSLGTAKTPLAKHVAEAAVAKPLVLTDTQRKVRPSGRVESKQRKIREAEHWLESSFNTTITPSTPRGHTARFSEIYRNLQLKHAALRDARSALQSNNLPPDTMDQGQRLAAGHPADLINAWNRYKQAEQIADQAGNNVTQAQIQAVLDQENDYRNANKAYLQKRLEQAELEFVYAEERYHNLAIEYDAHRVEHNVKMAFEKSDRS